MKTYLRIIFTFFFILSSIQNLFGQHEKKLQRIKDIIEIPQEIVLGTISYLDIDNKGNLLITDQMSKDVLLFNKKLKTFKSISPLKCTPGFNWRPIYSVFNNVNKNILVINSLPWGYKFLENGNCVEPMNYKFIAPSFIINTYDSRLVGYYNDDQGNSLKMMDENGNVLFTFGEFQNNYKNFIKRFAGGGLTTDETGKYIFKVDVHSPVLHKYNLQGKIIEKIKIRLIHFNHIERDLIENKENPYLVVKDLKTLMEGKSIIKNFTYYGKNKFIVITYTNKKHFIHLVNIKGDVLFESEIPDELSFLNSKNEIVYFSEQPTTYNSELLPNPRIIMYEIK